MAEVIVDTNIQEPENQTPAPQEQPKEPSIQEMMVEMAKLKRAQEKAASEAAEYKKKWREVASEKEVADQAKADAEAAQQEAFEAMKRELAMEKLTKQFLKLGYSEDLADKAAKAQYENDTDTLFKIQEQQKAADKKAWETEFFRNRPEMNAGVGGATVTKEQFENMSLQERTKLYRENPDLYKRLLNK